MTTPTPTEVWAQNAEARAHAAWQRVRHSPIAVTIDRAWHEARNRHVTDLADRIGRAEHAAALMTAFTTLNGRHIEALWTFERTANPNAALTPEARAALESHPILAAYQAGLDARAAEIDRLNQENTARLVEQQQREAPVHLLTELRNAGIALALGKHDALQVPQEHEPKLTVAQRAAIAMHKPGLLTILRNEAKATAPVTVA